MNFTDISYDVISQGQIIVLLVRNLDTFDLADMNFQVGFM